MHTLWITWLRRKSLDFIPHWLTDTLHMKKKIRVSFSAPVCYHMTSGHFFSWKWKYRKKMSREKIFRTCPEALTVVLVLLLLLCTYHIIIGMSFGLTVRYSVIGITWNITRFQLKDCNFCVVRRRSMLHKIIDCASTYASCIYNDVNQTTSTYHFIIPLHAIQLSNGNVIDVMYSWALTDWNTTSRKLNEHWWIVRIVRIVPELRRFKFIAEQ